MAELLGQPARPSTGLMEEITELVHLQVDLSPNPKPRFQEHTSSPGLSNVHSFGFESQTGI